MLNERLNIPTEEILSPVVKQASKRTSPKLSKTPKNSSSLRSPRLRSPRMKSAREKNKEVKKVIGTDCNKCSGFFS